MSKPAVDLEHLARYTGGDVALNSEVLQLFAGQIGELVGKLNTLLAAPDTKEWHAINHSIKGAARGIGAFDLADAAAHAEPIDPANTSDAAAAARELAVKAEAVCRFIQDYAAQ